MRAAIVCVDDEWFILKSLGEQLKRNFGKKYDVELASGGEDALSLCAELTAQGKHIPLIILIRECEAWKETHSSFNFILCIPKH
ncbi:MAG: hypothetical protein HC827_23965 [Cyanobacteria bacterium RM1_2_2]|nr:hypothetical protein [Cyanobacteria bacterium RM1_2_2]